MCRKSCTCSELGYRKSKTRKVKILVVVLLLCFAWNTIAFPVSALTVNEVAGITSIVSSVVSAVSNGASVWNAIRSSLSSANYDQINISLLSELVTMFASPYNPIAIGLSGSATEVSTTGTPGNLLAFINQNQAVINNQIKRVYDTENSIYNLENTHLNGIGSIVDQIYTQTYNQNANQMASNVLLSSINYNTSKYRYNDGLVDLFKRAGGALQTNSFAYAGFSTDVSFHTYYLMNIAFSVNANATALQAVIYDVTSNYYVPLYYVYEPYNGIAYCFFRLTAGHDYKLMGSRMSGYKYVPIYMGNDYFLPDELRPFFYLKSSVDYYASIDNKLSGLATIDVHVDGVEGLLNSISLNTDNVESKLATIDGHVDGVESKLDLIHNDLQNLPSGGGDSNTDIDVDLNLNFVDIAADLGVSVDFLKDTFNTGVDIPDSLALLILPDYFFTQDVYNTVNGSYPDVELVPLSDL